MTSGIGVDVFWFEGEGFHPGTGPCWGLHDAGVRFAGIDIVAALTDPITICVALGLVLGKVVGITLAVSFAVRSGVARLPIGSAWSHIRGLAVLGGIGFTVSLFATDLAFDDSAMADLTKIGIFADSAFAAVAGYFLLRKAPVPDER